MSQQYMLAGRRPRSSQVESINARTPMLPSLKQMKDDIAYRDRMANVSEANLALRGDELEQQQEQAKKANRLAMANLGITTGTGLMKMGVGGDDAGSLDAKSALINGKASDPSMFDTGTNSSGSVWEGAADGFGGALNAKTLGSGMIGAGMGSALGQYSPVGGGRGKKAIAGGVAGAALGYASSGGNIYSTIISGALGGALGGLDLDF